MKILRRVSVIKLNEVRKPGNTSWDHLGTVLAPCWGHLGALMGPPRPILAHLGTILGLSWRPHGAIRPLGTIWAPSWARLGPYWPFMVPSWGCLGALLGPSWLPLGPILVHPGGILGPSWRHTGPSKAVLGRSRDHLGALLGNLGAICRASNLKKLLVFLRILYIAVNFAICKHRSLILLTLTALLPRRWTSWGHLGPFLGPSLG